MKNHHHHNRYLPQPSPSDHTSLACDHRSAMKEITREMSLVTQLRAIVLPALQADERSELVAQMFQSILDCSSKAIAELWLHQSENRADDVLVDDRKRVRSISDDCSSKEEDAKPYHPHKRRRSSDSVSLETPVPHYDGHQWRKYGQKNISKAKHPRSYYRCTYRQEQDCKAAKTVQQQDDSIIGADHSVMYTVVYHGQHTCKDKNGVDSGPDDSGTITPSSSDLVCIDSQSSIAANCSDPYDHQTSLDGNKLLDKSADLITKNMSETFDMSAFALLDLDSWELDAILRFGADN
ncbi:WRKY DNA-binding transcription factor 70-like [Phragmites australis]|uniref:WRKY DNA-binding transcription factor 70-like n=1 Tax=Phragmites australis TaxID=29695 RepID=UPI002D77B79D|nr:WRKY DNA-binding transcription factor 70-like [Phragmites australis]